MLADYGNLSHDFCIVVAPIGDYSQISPALTAHISSAAAGQGGGAATIVVDIGNDNVVVVPHKSSKTCQSSGVSPLVSDLRFAGITADSSPCRVPSPWNSRGFLFSIF